MTTIRPFRGIRPAAEEAKNIAALPYDVYNSAEARAAVKDSPKSFLNIDRPETQFDLEHDMYAKDVYKKADEIFRKMIFEGDFVKEEMACYYLYALTFRGRRQTGLVACASIDDYMDGTIRQHENTRPEKELDRINHVDALSAQTGPIFLSYRQDDEMNAIVKDVETRDPLYDFISDDGIRHQVWRIDNAGEIEKITRIFTNIPRVYIADGHHRAASAVKVGLKRRLDHPKYTGEEEFNYFLSVLFPAEELRIFDYNRFVTDLNGLTTDELLRRLAISFDVEAKYHEQVCPKTKGTFGMYHKHQWYQLTAKESIKSEDAVVGLDVSILQDYVLAPILGIQNPKTSTSIRFVGGIRGLGELERLVDATEDGVAFSMCPTSMDELLTVADENRLMPPKSTWFEPKLRSGLLIHEFER